MNHFLLMLPTVISLQLQVFYKYDNSVFTVFLRMFIVTVVISSVHCRSVPYHIASCHNKTGSLVCLRLIYTRRSALYNFPAHSVTSSFVCAVILLQVLLSSVHKHRNLRSLEFRLSMFLLHIIIPQEIL